MHNTGVTGEAGSGLELVPIHIYGYFILYTFVILFPVITMFFFSLSFYFHKDFHET